MSFVAPNPNRSAVVLRTRIGGGIGAGNREFPSEAATAACGACAEQARPRSVQGWTDRQIGVEEAHEMIEAPLGDEGVLGWQERALCAQTDPEAFFPEKGGSTREAKKVCLSCDVRAQCLEYALANDERFGIWGGLSERERRRLKKRAV
jgi:WhiB family transcriptional regulator, redox-sensing transcriptional regulator